MENYFAMEMDRRQVNAISALGLAHMGDGVFELLVRSWLCGHGRTKAQNLHRETVSYVSATAKEYARATGLECLFGHLFLEGKTQRINQLFVTVMEELYGI